MNIKPLPTIIYNSQQAGFRQFVLRFLPKLREIGQNSGKVQKFTNPQSNSDAYLARSCKILANDAYLARCKIRAPILQEPCKILQDRR